MEKRHALGGARTLGKLDESSTGARLSAQMLGGQVKMHIGVIGMQSLAYDALFSLCTQKLLSLYGPKEDMSVHSNQRQRSLDMHCLFVYLAYLYGDDMGAPPDVGLRPVFRSVADVSERRQTWVLLRL